MTRLATFAGISAYGRAGFGGTLVPVGLGKGLAWGGYTGTAYSSSRSLISASGVVSADTTTVATARAAPSAVGFGTQQSIIMAGFLSTTSSTSQTNIVSALGVIAAGVSGAGADAGGWKTGVRYGTGGTGLMAYGRNTTPAFFATFNRISNTGVMATSVASGRTARADAAGTSYGTTGTGLIAFGTNISIPTYYTNYNPISTTGTVDADVAISGATTRYAANAASYGTDKGMFWSGANNYPGSVYLQLQNLVSNTGVIASETTISSAVGKYSGASMGINGTSNSVTGDKCIFTLGFNSAGRPQSSQLFDNTGTWVSITTTTASARSAVAGATYG